MALWSISSLQDIQDTRRIDSEFFRPDYLAAEHRARAGNVEDMGTLGRFVPGPFGSAFHVQNYDVGSPYRYIRGMDVKPFFLLNEDNRYISALDFHRLSQYVVRKDDLMISVVGTLGNVAVCTGQDVPAMFSCKSTLFRSLETDPYFLLAYLNSGPGQLCMLRRQRGAIQTGLNIEDLKTIPIPRFGEALENELAEKVRSAYWHLLSSRDAYSNAKQLLDSALGLDKLKFQKPLGYTTSLSEIETSRRFDSERYFPAFRAFRAGLPNSISLSALSHDLDFCKRGKQPTYSATGLPVVNSKHVQPNRVLLDKNRLARPNLDTNLQIRFGDTLLNGTGRGTIGRAAPYLSEEMAVPDILPPSPRLRYGTVSAAMETVNSLQVETLCGLESRRGPNAGLCGQRRKCTKLLLWVERLNGVVDGAPAAIALQHLVDIAFGT
jgi:hypothetical protein